MSANSSDPSSSSSSSVMIPGGKRTRSSPRLRERQLVFEVLDNPSLREEILKHAIIGGDKKLDQRSACTLRRVDRSWNESVLRILWKANMPLYRIRPEAGGNLDIFLKAFASYFLVSAPPPPLNLERYSSLYDVSDIEIFSNFLTSCGPALLQLGFTIYDFGHPLTVQLPSLSLSRLHKLDIIVALRPRDLLTAREQPEAELEAVRQTNIPEGLINSIFLGARALAELTLNVHEWSRGDPAGADVSIFDSIIFPSSLVTIKLEIDLDIQQAENFLNALLNCPLPKVTSLSFIAWDDAFAGGLLFRLMDKWKSCLKNLAIECKDYRGAPRNVTAIRLPAAMKQMEEFSISSSAGVQLELESGLDSLEKCFPKLRTLRLRRQSLGMLRKWTESSRFSGVTFLELILAFDQRDFLMKPGKQSMRLVNSAFPNLRKLELGMDSSDPRGLRYVFQEMRQLVALKLKVSSHFYERGTDVWDSILSGVSPEMIASIRERGPGSLEAGDGLVPITNLQELKSFSVKYDGSSFVRYGNPRSVISDFIFNHAFLRMPQLTHLHFEGPFEVSQEMTDIWMRGEGRSLFYQRFSSGGL